MKRFDLSLLCILLLALGGGLLVLFASPWGIGLSPDSVQYIQAARNLRLGFGLSIWGKQGYQPLTHFPPLYPLILAVAASSRETILAWAHGLQAILFHRKYRFTGTDRLDMLPPQALARRTGCGAGYLRPADFGNPYLGVERALVFIALHLGLIPALPPS